MRRSWRDEGADGFPFPAGWGGVVMVREVLYCIEGPDRVYFTLLSGWRGKQATVVNIWAFGCC